MTDIELSIIQDSVECETMYQELVESGYDLQHLERTISDIADIANFIRISGSESLINIETTGHGSSVLANIGIENVSANLRKHGRKFYDSKCLSAATEGFKDKLKELWEKIKAFLKKVIGWIKYVFLGGRNLFFDAKLDAIEKAIQKSGYVDKKKIVHAYRKAYKKQVYIDYPTIVDTIHSILEDSLSAYLQSIDNLKTLKLNASELQKLKDDLDKGGKTFVKHVAEFTMKKFGISESDLPALIVEFDDEFNDSRMMERVLHNRKWTAPDYAKGKANDYTLGDLGFNTIDDFKQAFAKFKSGLGNMRKFSSTVVKLEKLSSLMDQCERSALWSDHFSIVSAIAKCIRKITYGTSVISRDMTRMPKDMREALAKYTAGIA